MNYNLSVLYLVCLAFFYTGTHAQSLLPYVQPLSGTAASTTGAALKHSEAGSEKNANTIPAVGLPFAMTQWTPQTQLTENKCIPPYFYKDTMLSGIRGTHWLSGSCTQDYGSFTVMPVVGKLKTKASDYALPFSHDQETTSPAYYKLLLPQQHIQVEMTATARSGFMQFTSAAADSLYLLVTPNSDQGKGYVKIDVKNGVIWGYNPAHRLYQGKGESAGFEGWFYIRVEKAIGTSGTFSGAEVFADNEVLNKKEAGAYVGFKMKKGEQLRLRIGTSFSSKEGARNNLAAEIGTKCFDAIRKLAEQNWEASLSQVTVQTTSEKDKRIFYTAMYHAMQHPRLFSDVDHTYPAFASDNQLKKMADGHYYDDFSMWDTYRAQLPLMEILKPEMVNAFVQSLILKGQQGGWLPIFPCWNNYTAAMIGDHVTAFIASAYHKGIRKYDTEAAYQLMHKNAFQTPNDKDYKNGMGRRALTTYLKYGYIPMQDSVPEAYHTKEQVSRTLEYAFDDYALSVMAKGMNKDADFKTLTKRALNYANVFDPSVGMVRGRNEDGSWDAAFHADKRVAYITEGTPRQYTFYVPHDIPGLAHLMGGTKSFENALDSLFHKNEYWHGNEPGHQIPFLYNYTSSPFKTQKAVREIITNEYSDGPGGLSGNDDAGQMSAWYVFASLGFYPVNPVSNEYQLTSPLFDQVKIKINGENTFEIVTHKSAADALYINKVHLNGKLYEKNYITYDQIIDGGKLEFWLKN
jgi:predicted alpha-1,2-mannosidase